MKAVIKMTKLLYETNPFLDTLTTSIMNERQQGKHYLYELQETIFFVEGGGQLKDEGTINGVPVLSCLEKDGRIYHETAAKIEGTMADLKIDVTNRFISRQGHTAQHLISAGFYEIYGLSTISHHYDTRGSYIDLDTSQVTDKMLRAVENWVNEAIRTHHEIEVLYPSASELKMMPIHHTIKTTDKIRIVHIKDIEYNPCKGMHVTNTSEVGMLVIFDTELVRQKVRVHYFFGEVARLHLHHYHDELKKVSTALSKPMSEAYAGLKKLQEQMLQQQLKYEQLADELITLHLEKMAETANHHYMLGCITMDNALSARVTKKLQTYDKAYGYLIFNRRLMAFAGKNSGHDARVLFKKAADQWQIKGGGHALLCQGGLTDHLENEELLCILGTWVF